jgi:flagellar biosynthetic protein FliR
LSQLVLPAGLRLPELAGTQLVSFVLVMARVGPLFLLAPVLSATLLPARAKFALAAGMALALAPLASQDLKVPDDPVLLATTLAQEIGVGIAFALSLAVIAAAIQAGAGIVDTLVGFSFSSLVDPFTGLSGGVLGRVYGIFASMIFILSGGIRLMVMGLAKSYEVVPLGSFPAPAALAKLAVSGLAALPVIALELVGPIILAVVVADAAFGLVSRAVPQMNVFVVGLPVKVIISFAVLGTSLPFVATKLQSDLEQAISQTLRALGGG